MWCEAVHMGWNTTSWNSILISLTLMTFENATHLLYFVIFYSTFVTVFRIFHFLAPFFVYLFIISFQYIIPHCQSWKLPFAQVLFDSDPADNQGKNSHVLEEEMSQAMIR